MSYMNMKLVRTRWAMLLIALLFTFAACSSESPTAPQPGGGGTGTPPAQSASIAISISNPNPVVESTSTITATVTQDGQPAPNGTAVEFSTTLGRFTDTGEATTVRTTTNGVATAVLTSDAAGQARVTARVGNVSQTANVQFRVSDGGNGEGGATITAIDPATGGPSGGQIVSIRGTNFSEPVRVLFGNREATVVSVSPTEIRVVVPQVTLAAGEQAREVDVVVINRVGNEGEARITAPTRFRYQVEVLTPVIYAVDPSSGPNEGNTRITIFGEGFQAPVRVYFGTGGGAGAPLENQTEVEVLQVTFGQIVALTPPVRDIYGNEDPFGDRQVTVRVLNIASNRDAVQPSAFRYGQAMRITAVSPTQGPYTGGTQVTIHGWGFDDPVAVTVGGVAAQPIRVSGTEIVVRTAPIDIRTCADVSGPITVTNIEDGNSAAGPEFTFRVPQATVVGVSPSNVTVGGTAQITVFGAGNPAFGRFKIGTTSVFPSSATVNQDGTTTFGVVIPTTLELETRACPEGGERQVATAFDITYLNTQTGCTDTIEDAVIVQPASAPVLFLTEPPALPNTTVGSSSTTQFQAVNTGTSALTVSSVSSNNADFNASPGAALPAVLGPCESMPVNVTFTPSAAGQQTATITVVSDGGTRTVQITATGSEPAP